MQTQAPLPGDGMHGRSGTLQSPAENGLSRSPASGARPRSETPRPGWSGRLQYPADHRTPPPRTTRPRAHRALLAFSNSTATPFYMHSRQIVWARERIARLSKSVKGNASANNTTARRAHWGCAPLPFDKHSTAGVHCSQVSLA